MDFNLTAFLEGLLVSLGSIMVIGMQNAFVLKQGIMRNHVLITSLICAFCDAILIIFGVSGLGAILSSNPTMLKFAKYGGIIFLYGYGIKSFISATKTNGLVVYNEVIAPNLKQTILTAFAVSIANPNAVLDTCVIIGGVSSNFAEELKPSFASGAIFASFVWFILLGFGARYLRKFFENPRSWKILDFIIGCTMFALASALFYSL